jgi:SAM-dependent methyltransferase
MSLRTAACRILARAERVTARARARLEQGRMKLPADGAIRQVERVNQAGEWEQVYASHSMNPVTALNSPVAVALEQLTKPGDVLLEAGCGSATISAELALAGRRIYLADFSQLILDRATRLFELSGLPKPEAILADLTRPLPLPDKSVDVVWSSGVLEHWTDEELGPIIGEMVRISRRRVVSLVPYAGSVLYRFGKWVAETRGSWPYGRELPRETLRPAFEKAGLQRVSEKTIWSEQAVHFLEFFDPELRREAAAWWSALQEQDPLRRTQGYLLLTVGEVI